MDVWKSPFEEHEKVMVKRMEKDIDLKPMLRKDGKCSKSERKDMKKWIKR